MPFLQGVNFPFGVPYLRRNVVRGSDASNASDVIRITNHVRRNVDLLRKGEPVRILAYYGSHGPAKIAEAAVMTRRKRRRRRNEAELHITSTKKYNSIGDKEDNEEIAKQLAKARKVCLSEVPNKQIAATY
ncbi:uncharacterized protein LOC131065801 [Cryptomeria japonica]|uniref:uncharacterized protein LOC131065801 n=1 Tax=Cryptomeria japonica TaxID=3369 RepID=UPI0027DA25EE|nr:uncharacterized protein LOC131065801 [Cryptomeria japonica]